MKLNLKNYKNVLSKELLKQAEKNKVRECDETDKGNFIAYVDEGDDSFDVALKISAAGEITAHSCDCKNGNDFCRHQAALLLHIEEAKKIKQPVKLKQQISASESLLEEIPTDKLKEWVKALLAKNKDLELAFVHYFSAKKYVYATKEVEQITADAIKAVVKNKKNIDPTELKKIISLWQNMHAPVIEAYRTNVSDETLFLNFHTVIESCLRFDATMNANSNKILKYTEDLLQQQTEIINNVYVEEAWEKATGYFIKYLHNDLHAIRMHYLLHLKNLIIISNEERRKKLLDAIINNYSKSFPEHIANGDAYTKALFDIVEQFNLINQYYTVFKPIRFNNDYNEKLITLLIENSNYKLAAKYCDDQIKLNYREEYNIPYLVLLKKIYEHTKDDTKLAKIISDLFPYTYNFNDFLYIYNRMPDGEEKKKWRTKILSRARQASRSNKHAMKFCFGLMDYEKKYKKMIDYLDSYTPYEIILRYFEPMVFTDKNSLLKTIISRSDDTFIIYTADGRQNTEIFFPALLTVMLKFYTKDYLKAAIKNEERNSWHYRLNRFTAYIKKELETETVV